VPSYFDHIDKGKSLTIDLPQIWPSPKLLGFDACVVIACERPFDIQFSPFSYDWDWGYERYFCLYLKPDFHSTDPSTEDEEEVVKSDHLLIIRGLKNFSNQINKLGIKSDLQFSEELKSPSAKLQSCGIRLIWEVGQADKSIEGEELPLSLEHLYAHGSNSLENDSFSPNHSIKYPLPPPLNWVTLAGNFFQNLISCFRS